MWGLRKNSLLEGSLTTETQVSENGLTAGVSFSLEGMMNLVLRQKKKLEQRKNNFPFLFYLLVSQ